MVDLDSPQITIMRRMRIVCWIAKATDTHPECEILIVFPRQHWLRERASILRFYLHHLPCEGQVHK
jgi:hypothetical protein